MSERCIGCGRNIKKNFDTVERHGAVWCSQSCVDAREKEEDLAEQAMREKSEAFADYQQAIEDINDNSPSDGTTCEQWETLQDALDAYILVVARQDKEGA